MKVNEILISMALGAFLFAPIASTAQNAAGFSPAARQAPSARTQHSAPLQQQSVQTQMPSARPVSCPVDPTLSARLDKLQRDVSTMSVVLFNLGQQPSIAELRDQIEMLNKQVNDLKRQQDQTKKDLADLAGRYVAFNVQTTTQFILLGAKVDSVKSSFGSREMQNFACTGLSCIPAGQVTVVTWK